MRTWLRRILIGLGVVLGLVVAIVVGLVIFVQVAWDRPYNRPVREMTAPNDPETIARGAYIFNYGWQCWDCHSQGVPSPDAPQAGGREFDLRNVGPGFGVFYAPNITPDPETGIGAWTDGEIVRSLREGLNREGRMTFTIMGREFLHGLSDEDALAVVAYLRSLPPVRNEAPPSRLSFMAKALLAFRVIKPLPAITEPVVAPPEGETAAYGEYVARHASSCAECHTPRDVQKGIFFMDQLFAGSTIAFGGEFDHMPAAAYAPNITPHNARGIGTWSEDDFIAAMTHGTRPDGTVILPFMPWPYYSFWKPSDLRAVYRYLRSLPLQEHTVPPPEFYAPFRSEDPLERGEAIFRVYCEICHGVKGAGAPPTTKVLADVAPTLPDAAIEGFVRGGIPDTRMPAFQQTLSAQQITDVIRYIRSW